MSLRDEISAQYTRTDVWEIAPNSGPWISLPDTLAIIDKHERERDWGFVEGCNRQMRAIRRAAGVIEGESV
jgi:hypothetical protein